ncbi:hypothetical protein AZI11_13820 (plasmid) [Levilactobacillus brevis]|uniref:hypothetical protein n=1 Tax=Levilactobacillus brevis TaxID=1580 RepID=UPI000A205414|nr:hypothetical protein [Levilactobacillus brevis]ARN94003.1 hypothetical protein AZI11_13820 [Levilactobacillus brevis]ARN96576.1 hypothetical protein AZI12_13905 [Levilactobacillus brevis]
MTNYQNKEEQALERIVNEMLQLDAEVTQAAELEENPDKGYTFKAWRAEQKALHNIKRILHEAHKYDGYEEKEEEQTEKDLQDLEDYQKKIEDY